MDRLTSNQEQNYQRPILHNTHIVETFASSFCDYVSLSVTCLKT